MSNAQLFDLFASFGVVHASSAGAQDDYLASGKAELDELLGGGLAVGSVTEWGVPLGLGGRSAVLSFIASATRSDQIARPRPVLWTYPPSSLKVYPPAWAAAGVNLERVAYCETEHPVRDLRPALVGPFFKIVVFDMPPLLSRDDFAFLAQQARAHKKIFIVLRNEFLQHEKGNVWAKLRINAAREPDSQHLRVEVIRGLSPRQGKINIDESDQRL